MKRIGLALTLLMLAGCAELDMQGRDPRVFYEEHPVENRVETRHLLYTLDFGAKDKKRLSPAEIEDFRAAVRDVAPEAVESIRVTLALAQKDNQERKDYIGRLLRGHGYSRRAIVFETSDAVSADEADLDISYASVVLPHCPDWRTSPVTTYSNERQANFGCATTVNLGLQVANPRDLEKGVGSFDRDTERTATVIKDYRTGSGASAPASDGPSPPPAGSTPTAQ